MSDFLQTMAALSAARASALKLAAAMCDKLPLPLNFENFDIIAEIKDRSPAEGDLAAANGDRAQRAADYAAGGAVAISVLTEPSRFAGSMSHLEDVVAAVPNTPVMRKDFLVEPIQIVEARNAGASGVLLIAAILDDNKLQDMLACAYEHDMFVLLESFDGNDLARTSTLLEDSVHGDNATNGQLLVGVNSRDLRTLELDRHRLHRLAATLPAARCVAESGLHTADDAAAAAGWGYQVGLVGTALMRHSDPAALIADMRRAGSARTVA